MKYENFEKACILIKEIREYKAQLNNLKTAYDVTINCHTSIQIKLSEENNSPLKLIAQDFTKSITECIETQLTFLYHELEKL